MNHRHAAQNWKNHGGTYNRTELPQGLLALYVKCTFWAATEKVWGVRSSGYQRDEEGWEWDESSLDTVKQGAKREEKSFRKYICIHSALPWPSLPIPHPLGHSIFFSLTWDPEPSASNPLVPPKSPLLTFFPHTNLFSLSPARKGLRGRKGRAGHHSTLTYWAEKGQDQGGQSLQGAGILLHSCQEWSRSRGECCDFLLLSDTTSQSSCHPTPTVPSLASQTAWTSTALLIVVAF